LKFRSKAQSQAGLEIATQSTDNTDLENPPHSSEHDQKQTSVSTELAYATKVKTTATHVVNFVNQAVSQLEEQGKNHEESRKGRAAVALMQFNPSNCTPTTAIPNKAAPLKSAIRQQFQKWRDDDNADTSVSSTSIDLFADDATTGSSSPIQWGESEQDTDIAIKSESLDTNRLTFERLNNLHCDSPLEDLAVFDMDPRKSQVPYFFPPLPDLSLTIPEKVELLQDLENDPTIDEYELTSTDEENSHQLTMLATQCSILEPIQISGGQTGYYVEPPPEKIDTITHFTSSDMDISSDNENTNGDNYNGSTSVSSRQNAEAGLVRTRDYQAYHESMRTLSPSNCLSYMLSKIEPVSYWARMAEDPEAILKTVNAAWRLLRHDDDNGTNNMFEHKHVIRCLLEFYQLFTSHGPNSPNDLKRREESYGFATYLKNCWHDIMKLHRKKRGEYRPSSRECTKLSQVENLAPDSRSFTDLNAILVVIQLQRATRMALERYGDGPQDPTWDDQLRDGNLLTRLT
jgi:hypothetical protein